MSESQLRTWQRAGLIDSDTANRIRTWEAQNPRPVGIWAIVGLGALTIGLGIIIIVAANWDLIPGLLRLSVHFATMAAVAGWTRRYLSRSTGNAYFADGLLIVLAMLGLTFFAHVGQVYQTSSPLWHSLLLWLLTFSPALLLFGRDWPVVGLWMAGVLCTAWAHTDQYGNIWMLERHAPAPMHPAFYWGLIASPPMGIAALAAYMRSHSRRPQFWRLLEQFAIATIVAGISLLILVRGWETRTHYLIGSVLVQSAALIAAAALTFVVRPTRSGRATTGLLAAAAAVHIIEALLLDLSHPARGPWIGSVLFITLWSAIAVSALYAEWRGIFQIAIGVIAIRLIVLSIELNDNLLSNGLSLILSGIFAMIIAWATVQVSRHFAPGRAKRHG